MGSLYDLLRQQANEGYSSSKSFWDDYGSKQTGLIDSDLLRGMNQFQALQDERTSQLGTQKSELLSRLGGIESARRDEGALVRAAQQAQLSQGIQRLQDRQGASGSALAARGIDASRLGPQAAEALALLDSQRASQTSLGDRLERAESVGAEDRELSARRGFDDASSVLAAHLFAGRAGLEDEIADRRGSLESSLAKELFDIASKRDSSLAGISAAELDEQIKARKAAAAYTQRKTDQADADAETEAGNRTAAAAVAQLLDPSGALTDEQAYQLFSAGLFDDWAAKQEFDATTLKTEESAAAGTAQNEADWVIMGAQQGYAPDVSISLGRQGYLGNYLAQDVGVDNQIDLEARQRGYAQEDTPLYDVPDWMDPNDQFDDPVDAQQLAVLQMLYEGEQAANPLTTNLFGPGGLLGQVGIGQGGMLDPQVLGAILELTNASGSPYSLKPQD